MIRTPNGFLRGAVSGVTLVLVLAPWTSATAGGDAPAPGSASFIELITSTGRPEARFDASCGTAEVEILDPDSSDPRLVLSGSCGGVAFDVVAHPTALPASLVPNRVRFIDVATGQERIATQASLDVQKFGDVGSLVSGRLDFTMPRGLNRPPRQIHGTFQVVRRADRFSP